ncbi:hypothetical protein [Kitasatospora sp. NPDC059571]|uniref:hypothetical protein n=1 Tax=Kitasatospora sp. NPDC059571 TaxID=3346871 RepID=UPI0036D1F1AE
MKDVQGRSSAKGLRLTVTVAAHSAHELEAARDTLQRRTRGKDAAAEPAAAWNSIAVMSDGSGLVVTYNSPSSQQVRTRSPQGATHAVPQQRITTASPARFATRVQSLTGVPVQAAAAPGTRRGLLAGRRLLPVLGRGPTPHPHQCVLHIGLRRLARRERRRPDRLPLRDLRHLRHRHRRGGRMAGDDSLDYDTTFVNLNGSAGTQFYDGAWNDPNGYHKHVASWGLNHDGDYVCTSGAMSGIHCNLKVKYAGVDISIGGIVRHNVVEAFRTDSSTIAVAQGDSGGPVVTSTDGTWGSEMQARGLISGGDGEWVVCPTWGVGTAGQTACYSGVACIGMSAIVNTLGFTLNT